MVAIVTAKNFDLYETAMEEMYRLRYFVAIEELGWQLPDSEGSRDKDAYDRDDTIYFLDFDDAGELIGTARLNPTTKPHLMTDIFPTLCSFTDIPVAPDIYEFSRFLVKKTGVNRRVNIRSQARLCLAVVEYCLAANIKQVSWVSYKRSYPLALRMWETRPLGLPRYFEVDDKDYIAAISDMTLTSLRRTQKLAKMDDPVGRITVPLARAPSLFSFPKPHHMEYS